MSTPFSLLGSAANALSTGWSCSTALVLIRRPGRVRRACASMRNSSRLLRLLQLSVSSSISALRFFL